MKNGNKSSSVRESIAELNKRSAVIKEQRKILVSELSADIIKRLGSDSPETMYREFLTHLDLADVFDKLTFCEKLSANYSHKDLARLLLSRDGDGIARAGAHGKIAYIRNRYNDEAYEKFSEFIPHAKQVLYSDFEDCCEAIASGECEFTILPLEDSSDGKMFGFYSLLDRYGLKITLVCNVEREDNSKNIKYALAARSFNDEYLEKTKKDLVRTFEFTLTQNPSTNIVDLYTAVALAGATENRVSSVCLPYGDNMARFYHTVSINKKTSFLPFLLFLSLEFPDYTPIGIYREI
jgi:hypothetical protein